jgi:hypothetical protein
MNHNISLREFLAKLSVERFEIEINHNFGGRTFFSGSEFKEKGNDVYTFRYEYSKFQNGISTSSEGRIKVDRKVSDFCLLPPFHKNVPDFSALNYDLQFEKMIGFKPNHLGTSALPKFPLSF